MKFSMKKSHSFLTLLTLMMVLGAIEFGLPSLLASGVSVSAANSPHDPGEASSIPTLKVGSPVQAPAGTVINPPGGFLGKPMCPSISFGACSSAAYWMAGYMDQVVSSPTADAVTALVSLPGTSGIPNDFIQPGNYLAVGIMGQSQTDGTSGCPQSCEGLDYANFAMLYTANNLDQTYIIGEVWTAPDPTKNESAMLMFSRGWTNQSLGYYKTIGITMKWNPDTGNLDWIARIYGVEQTLFSYTPHPTQQKVFHVGTHDNGLVVT